MSKFDPPAAGFVHSRDDAATARRYVVAGHAIQAPKLAPGLYVVATPIGNLRDVTLRALEVLAAADLIACEDTRVTPKLLAHYGISAPLTAYHDHNAAAARPKLLGRLADGAAVALVSDAGTPLVSDPGYKLVRAALEAGHMITSVPGSSSVLAALTLAGLPTDRFLFDGYLPTKAGQRRTRIAELARIPTTTVVWFETGPRLAATLADLAETLGAREAAICRELTKLHEEVRRGDLPRLARDAAGAAAPLGEIVIVVAPPAAGEQATASEVEEHLRDALARSSVKDAVAEVSEAAGLPRRDVYRRALALRKSDDGATH